MADDDRYFADSDLEQAIALRWTMRDIAAGRAMLLPINQDHLKTLIELGLVEMLDEEPKLTSAGHDLLSGR